MIRQINSKQDSQSKRQSFSTSNQMENVLKRRKFDLYITSHVNITTFNSVENVNIERRDICSTIKIAVEK